MKTNTNTLRRALETFAKTGKITLTASALMALALSAPVNAETITGNKTINSNYTPSENVLIVGTETASGTLDMTGGTMDITGGVANNFRGKNASIQIINGTLTLSNAVINTTNGVALNANKGNTASLVVNNGGKLLISGKYPVMGSEVGQSGTLTINEGGYVETLYTDANQTDDITFYVSGNGSGTVNIYGGTLRTSGGLQVARAYGANDGAGVAGTKGTINMTAGTLDVGKYFILGHNHPGTGDPNIGIFNMSGGEVTVGKNTDQNSVNSMQYFLVGCSDENVTTDKIQCQANISGDSKMTINGYVEISNGEWYPTVGSGTTTPSSMTVSDNAQITVKGPYFGVGSWGKLNMNGGSILYDPMYPSSSHGMANAGEMNLAGGKITTTHQFQNVSQGTVTLSSADSSLTVGGNFENSGKLVISAGLVDLQNTSTIKGTTGSLDISGGELRAKDNTLNYSGKTLNYSGGTLPETLNLTNTALNISANSWNVTSVNDTNGSTLNVAFTPDGTGTVLGSTTFTGFETEDVTLKFAAGTGNGKLVSVGTVGEGISYTLTNGNAGLYQDNQLLASADKISDLAPVSGNSILLSADITETGTLTLPEKLTIASNSDSVRTITGNGKDAILIAPNAAVELTLKNLTFDGGKGYIPAPESARGGAIYAGELTLDTDNVTFANNSAKEFGGAIAADGGKFTLTGNSKFENNISGNYGGAILAASKLTVSGSHTFSGNNAAIGGALSSVQGTVELSGNNIFTNNSAINEGGAIHGQNVILSGNGSTATFSGNIAYFGDSKNVAAANDIYTGWGGGVVPEGSVTIKDAGSYFFGGGILSKELSISDADVTFGVGSQTKISSEAALTDAHLTIETDGTTKFEVGTLTDNGGNTIDVDYRKAEAGETTVIKGNVSGLQNIPNVNYPELKDGEFGYVSAMDTKGLNVNIQKENVSTYHRIQMDNDGNVTNSGADDLSGLDAGQAGRLDEVVVTKAPTAQTAGLTANGALSFRSNNTTARTVESDGSTLVSNASDLTLNNVTLKSNSTNNAVVQGTDVNLTGKGIAGISAPKAIDAANVTLDGKLTVDGAIAGDTEIKDGAEITVTQRTDIDGDLTVGDAKVTIDDLGMTWVDHKDKDGNVSKVPQVDSIDVSGDIAFADGTVIEISFDETFDLDAAGSYEIMTGKGLTQDMINGTEFSFVNAIAQMDGLQMLDVSLAQNGALMLNVTGFGTVPEPSTWALLVLGGLGVFGVARKNRKAKK